MPEIKIEKQMTLSATLDEAEIGIILDALMRTGNCQVGFKTYSLKCKLEKFLVKN